MLSRRAAAVGALLVAVAVVAAFVVMRSRTGARESAFALDAAPASSASSRVAAHRFVPGREVTYAVTYASDGALRVGEAAQASHLVSSVRAKLVRTVLGTSPREGIELLLYRFVGAEIAIAIDESSRATDAARIEADLARGLVVEMTRSGTIASVRMDPAASSLSRAFARALAAWTQVALVSTDATSWIAREIDTNGPLAAAYGVVPRPSSFGDVLSLRKTKRPLGTREGERAALGEMFLRAETGSTAVVEIDVDVAQGEVVEIAGDETTDATLGGQSLAHTRTTFDAERTSARVLDAAALAALAVEIAPLLESAPMALDAHDATLGDSAKAEASRHWLGGATLAEITRGLDDEARAPREGRSFDLFLKVQAYAFLHPAECEAIARLLHARPPRGSASATIVAALAATGSKEAQAALVGVVTAHGATADQMLRIVPSLGMLASPLQETEDAVRTLRDTSKRADVAATAALALGIMARSIAATSPARATRIVDEALARLARDERDARDEAAVKHDLSVLGNTGSTRIVDDVVRLSRSGTPSVRAQAGFSLRFVADEAAEARLLELLARDDDVLVRARAAAALAYRDWTEASARTQRTRVVDEPDAAVRAELLRTLYAMRSSDPSVVAFVKERGERDADATVRSVAAAMIAAGE